MQFYTKCPFDIHYQYNKKLNIHFHDGKPIVGPRRAFLEKRQDHTQSPQTAIRAHLANASLADTVHNRDDSNMVLPHAFIRQPVAAEPSLANSILEVNNLDGGQSQELPHIILFKGVAPGVNLRISTDKYYRPTRWHQQNFANGEQTLFMINVHKKAKGNFKFTFVDDDMEDVVMENIPFTVFDIDSQRNNHCVEQLTISGFDSYHIAAESNLHVSKKRGGAASGTYEFKATQYGQRCDNPTDPFVLGLQPCSGLNSLWASVGFLFKHKSSFDMTFDMPGGGCGGGRFLLFGFKSAHTEAIPRTTSPPPTTTVFTTPELTTAPPITPPPPTPAPTTPPPTPPPAPLTKPTKPPAPSPPPTKPPPPKTPPPTPPPTPAPASLTTTQFLTPTTTPMPPGRPAGCYLKLEDFEGTDLSPELYTAATGRNKLALKKLKQADRCYK